MNAPAEVIYRDAMEERAYAYGRLTHAAKTAMLQLQYGNPVAAFETLRRAVEIADSRGGPLT